MRKNITKEKLKKGEVVIGTFVTFPSATTVEICGLAGFDFVLLDAEHGPLSPGACEDLVRAALSPERAADLAGVPMQRSALAAHPDRSGGSS